MDSAREIFIKKNNRRQLSFFFFLRQLSFIRSNLLSVSLSINYLIGKEWYCLWGFSLNFFLALHSILNNIWMQLHNLQRILTFRNKAEIMQITHHFIDDKMKAQQSSYPWTEEPGGLHSMGLQRVGHDWGDLACTHATQVNLQIPAASKLYPKTCYAL